MGIMRSSFYLKPTIKSDEARIVAEIKTICGEFEAYGYRRVTAELRHRDLLVNSKKVRRIMRENDLNPKRRRRYVATTDSNHGGPIFPNIAKNSRSTGLTSYGLPISPSSRLPMVSSTSL